jgi:hypothetical protein
MPAQEIIPSGIALDATLQSIDAKVPTKGQKSMANSVPIAIAFDQQAIEVIGNVDIAGSVEITNDAGNAIPVSAASLPLPSGAATEATVDAINDKTPALGSALAAASVPVVIASDQATVDVSVDLELVETLQALRIATELLAAQSSRFMPDTSGRNRVSVETGTVAVSSLPTLAAVTTVTTVTTTGTLTNQTNMGGLAANPQIPYLMMLGGDNLRRNITVS